MARIRILDRRVVKAGELLFEQGQAGNRAYFVEKGRVEVFREDRFGRHVIIAEIAAGSIVGEMAILNDDFRTASVRAIEDSVLVGISAGDLKRALGNTDAIFRAMMKLMVERLKKSNDQLYRQQAVLHDIGRTTKEAVDNLSQNVAPEHRESFQREVLPLLDRLQATLEEYEIRR